jgi:hypothetical protein
VPLLQSLPLGCRTLQSHFKSVLDNCKFLPMESKDLPCLMRLTTNLQAAKQAATSDALETFEANYQGHKELLKQLSKSLTTAVSDLKSAITGAAKRKAKMEDQSRKSAAARERSQVEAGAKVAGNPKPPKTVAIFRLNLEGSATPISKFEGDTVFKTAVAGSAAIFSLPWVLAGSEMLTSIFDPKADLKAVGSLKRWSAEFPNNKLCKENLNIVAPFLQSFGSDDFAPFFNMVIPQALQMDPKTPPLQMATKGQWLYGMVDQYVQMQLESSFLGAVFVNVTGSASVIAMPAASVLTYLKASKFKNQGFTLQAMSDCLRSFSAEDVGDMISSGAKVYVGTMFEMSCFYLPAGWILGLTPNNGQSLAGIKQNILPTDGAKDWKAAAEAVKATLSEPAAIKHADGVLDRMALT